MKTAVKERPILFSGPMVRAILEGRKTQTRRIAMTADGIARGPFVRCRKPNEVHGWQVGLDTFNVWEELPQKYFEGEHLWVRETFGFVDAMSTDVRDGVLYRADDNGPRNESMKGAWKPSIHMPRWASRLTLQITSVRVERLNEISEGDAIAEGVTIPSHLRFVSNGKPEFRNEARAEFSALWESINGPGSWAVNPWVWVVSFKRINV